MARTRGPLFCCAAVFALAASACDPSAESGVRTEVRDSAGVTIVENHGEVGPDGGGWSVTPEPLLSIGTFQGDSLQQLFQVQGAARLGNGEIAIANAGSGEIRFYDDGGRFLGSVGRKGEGPGEFQRPVLVGVLEGGAAGDTLVVADGQLRRISLVHSEEGFLSSARISDEIGGGGFPRGMLADRTIVMGGGFFFSSAGGAELTSGFSRQDTNYRSAGLNGELVTDFGEFPGSEFFMEVRNMGGGAVSMRARLIPFGKYAMQAVGPEWFYYGSGDRWEVRAYDAGGNLRRLIRLDRDPVPVQDGDLQAYIEEAVAQAADPTEAPEIRSGYEEMPVPDFMPAFAGLHTDALGYLWVERYRRPGEAAPVFDILDPGGALVGRVAIPDGSEILEIGTDDLLVLQRDELEVEYVRLLELRRPTMAPPA